MPSQTDPATPSRWRRWVAGLTAFAEAVERDETNHMHARMTWLDHRLAALEARSGRLAIGDGSIEP